MREEVWKDIPGYEGLYQVSSLSRIRSVDKVMEVCYIGGKPFERKCKGKILKPWVGPHGYLSVALYKEGICEFCAVHRLVAVVHLENPKGYNLVTFRDKNKNNIKLENLRWGRKD